MSYINGNGGGMSEKHHENFNIPNCRFEDRQLEILNNNFSVLNKQVEAKDKWVKEYIDRTMPIRSHIYILLASLSILSAFAAVMRFIEKTNF